MLLAPRYSCVDNVQYALLPKHLFQGKQQYGG